MNSLRPVVDGLWLHASPLRVAGMDFGRNMVVLRGADGLTLVSPGRFTEGLRAEVEALGPVRRLVAPNRFHNLHLDGWLDALPDATCLAPPGFREQYGLRVDRELEHGTDALGPELEVFAVEGVPKVREFAVRHASSRTVVVADVLFNLPPQRGVGALLARLVGLHRGPARSRLYSLFVKDRDALHASLRVLLDAGFDRLVPGHGAVVERDPEGALARAWSVPGFVP